MCVGVVLCAVHAATPSDHVVCVRACACACVYVCL